MIIAVDEAAEAVDGWRERTCTAKPSAVIPPHLTLLFPFVPAADIDERVITSLAEATAGTRRFTFHLRRTDRFPTTLYLVPEPGEPFIRLTRSIMRHFPAYQPYDGAFGVSVPHLTVAEGSDAVMDRAQLDVTSHLPISSVAQEALLLKEVEPNREWRIRLRLPFSA